MSATPTSAETSHNPQVRSPHNPRVMMSKNPLPTGPLPLGWDEITKILPHRYPMLLVDKITELEPGHRCVGLKNVSATEEFFQGHFPGHPVMPGVLILEAMAQVAGVLILVSRNTPGALSYFAKVEKARFLQPVRPGDQLVTEATLQVLRGPYCTAQVIGRVDGQVVVEADYTFMTTIDSSAQTIVRAANPNAIQGAEVLEKPQETETAKEKSPALVSPVSRSNGTIHTAQNGATPKAGIHPTALVDPSAQIAEGVTIGPFCIVEANTSIGEGTSLESHVVIKRGTSIGKNCRIWPHVVLGHEPQDMKYKGEESFLRIGDNNILREMVTIHRATGAGEATILGNNNLLMAYVHIGHNCSIGSNTMISNSTGISGHVTIEDKSIIGGFVGIHQFVHIGKMAMVGGLSKVVQDVPPFCIADGRPAKIHGLNIRGLRRNGVESEQRNQVGTAFKLLYRSGLNTSQALERVHAEVPASPTLDYLTDFLERVREGRLGRQDETAHL
ncbi:3-hydroxyacyl-[acyl-carrier-protein] dehydratase /acyl-[acyl-carrier-protein]--UDP-N-acetylglucosamine O-acyltransferase [Abditibacterium utsteinense]|uniref:Multifunctional fusion protein n=1 Tax=Abditibacterium utsteinense TaxID=1960156 RepID=A0A2S8SX25_9BACT|nr:acyl-ACP--UDP-N-acetylglucosamine O-acyltransferase [Abditibacterium utsteinense]PQV65353.1 3-hydroxyacyl-[acyl-carrier-protein] dehydratase /acyl-[acyl-carrier-protein]--UDP-N-acetylglucosamine O-acyltransferase [Abditibacterium utsteinense]